MRDLINVVDVQLGVTEERPHPALTAGERSRCSS